MQFVRSSRVLKSVFAVLALTMATMSAPRKADAGILLAVIPPFAGASGMGILTGVSAGLFATSVGIGVMVTDHRAKMLGVGALLIVLDDNSASTQTEAALAARYSFIEDRAVIADLASALAEKSESAPAVEGGKIVSLSREEILDILAPTDVVENNAAAVEAMIAELN